MTLRLGGDGAITGCTSLENPDLTVSGLTISGSFDAEKVLVASGTAAAPSYTFSGDTDNGLYNAGTNSIGLSTAGTNAILIDSSSKVGIGTTSPANNLDIAVGSNNEGIRISSSTNVFGKIDFHANRSGADAALGILDFNWNNTQVARIIGGTGTDTTNKDDGVLQFHTAAAGSASEAMRIDSSGKVGIGENSPDQLLHLKSTGFPTIRVEDGDNSTYFDIANSDGDIILKADEGNTFANSAIRFMVDSSEHMRIDSSGRLLVGTTSATAGSQNYHTLTSKLATNTAETFGIQYPSVATYGFSVRSNGDLQINKDGTERMRIDSSGVVKLTQSGNNPRYGSLEASGDAFKLKAFSGNSGQNATMQFFTGANSPTQRMRIDSAGKVIVSSTTYTNHTSAQFLAVGNGTNSPMATFVPLTVSYTNIYFRNPNGNVGSIATSGSATSYNTSSDYRLKENVVDISDGITRVKQLSPKRFNFIVDTDTTVDGFLAHEAQTVVPEAVTGEKDGEEMQGIDQSKLVPLLTAALQEAIGEIETLKQRLSDAGIA